MKAIAAVIATMRAKGMNDSDILDVVAAMASVQDGSRMVVDEQAERRRAYDRERKSAERLRKSADNPSPLCPPLSLPQPPTQSPPISPQPTLSGKPDPVPVKAKPIAYPPAFTLLHDTFPKHPNASKSEALKAWTRLTPDDQDRALDGAVRYAEFLEKERRRRPDYPQLHLVTYINQRRWESLLEDVA